jgi:hypothetical protein
VIPLPRDLLQAIQARVARGALGALIMRSAGARGAVLAARGFLSEMDLRAFRTTGAARFSGALDDATEGLQRAFPKPARNWGLARKSINLFLRDCLSNVYLRDAHSLQMAELLYEVPLDTITGTTLHRLAGGTLPRWRTLRDLTPAVSDDFQAVAARIAGERGIARMHLDAIWWSQRGTGSPP